MTAMDYGDFARADIEIIRARYPTATANPQVDVVTGEINEYCVGMAVCRYFNNFWPYPSEVEDALTQVFYVRAPMLSEFNAQRWAGAVIDDNDAGYFDSAWRLATTALSVADDRAPPEVARQLS